VVIAVLGTFPRSRRPRSHFPHKRTRSMSDIFLPVALGNPPSPAYPPIGLARAPHGSQTGRMPGSDPNASASSWRPDAVLIYVDTTELDALRRTLPPPSCTWPRGHMQKAGLLLLQSRLPEEITGSWRPSLGVAVRADARQRIDNPCATKASLSPSPTSLVAATDVRMLAIYYGSRRRTTMLSRHGP